MKGSCSGQDLLLPLSLQKVEELEVVVEVEVVIRDEFLPSQRARVQDWIHPCGGDQIEASSLFLKSPERR